MNIILFDYITTDITSLVSNFVLSGAHIFKYFKFLLIAHPDVCIRGTTKLNFNFH